MHPRERGGSWLSSVRSRRIVCGVTPNRVGELVDRDPPGLPRDGDDLLQAARKAARGPVAGKGRHQALSGTPRLKAMEMRSAAPR